MNIGREQELILRSVQKYNILPLTSVCNMNCVFCSHRQNPKGIQVYWTGNRSLEQIKEAIEFLASDRKIVIGESATKIIEGEPFCHPQLLTVLAAVRAKFKHTPLQITTNGTGLNSETVSVLDGLKPLELYVSLNTINPDKRRLLMGDENCANVKNGIMLLAGKGIDFHGSIVAMPHLVGWEDLKQTILFLAEAGALTIRIFLPGFTWLAEETLKFSPKLHQELSSFVEVLAKQVAVPLIVEPQILKNLDPIIDGIIIGSPAERVGFKRGDRILAINGQQPRCRVEAFDNLSAFLSSSVVVERDGKEFELQLQRDQGERVGIVIAYDLLPQFWDDLIRVIDRYQSKRPLLLVSRLAKNLISAALEKEQYLRELCTIQTVENKFFGGSIAAGGLLVVDDFITALNSYQGLRPDLLLLPFRAFDDWGRDLKGRSYLFLQEEKDIPVELLEC